MRTLFGEGPLSPPHHVTRIVVGTITCAWCHREAVVNHAGRARFCSDACRQASHRDSHRDEYSAATRAWRARKTEEVAA
jgi:CRISPR/Cas system-associated protein Cas10 (large subunit of type III CRISPR-Cas system)